MKAEQGSSPPVIVLVDPQMGENIGATARAMLNCGLTALRLVRPRDGWPNERATAMASGAFDHMLPVTVYETTASALADLHFTCATTARTRDQVKPVLSARGLAETLWQHTDVGQRTGILFGAERAGLTNEDIALADAIVTIPLNPDFSSLNLAQAVLIAAYEWRMARDHTPCVHMPTGESQPATHAERDAFIVRLEQELESHHFFRSADMRPTMIRNIRNALTRAAMTDQEVRTFHGILTALTGGKSPLRACDTQERQKEGAQV